MAKFEPINLDQARTWIKKHATTSTGRPSPILIGGGLVALVMVTMSIYQPISLAFARQSVEMRELRSRMTTLPFTLDRFQRSRLRQTEIERTFKEVEFTQGIYSHLDQVAAEAGVNNKDPAFNIKSDGEAKPFGQRFKQEPWTVTFSSSNVESVISFLDKVTHGPRPLLLTRIQLENRGTTGLKAEIGLSSVRESGSKGGDS